MSFTGLTKVGGSTAPETIELGTVKLQGGYANNMLIRDTRPNQATRVHIEPNGK